MRYLTVVVSVALGLAQSAAAAPVQLSWFYKSTISSDGGGRLDLKAELNYDNAVSGAPIAVVMHSYSGVSTFAEVRQNAQRLRDAGFFVLSVSMRGRDGSDGVRDSGGLEIYDIYDAVEAAKVQYASFVDPTNVHITGYSGGGGNVMSALTKFPDYFRAGSSFFGMSDYGYDAVDGWYNKGASTSHRSILVNDIGNPNLGDPDVTDRYHARASSLASQNNPYSEIHLFGNPTDPNVPTVNHINYRDNAIANESFAGEFDNITVHIGAIGTYQDFDGDGINDPNEEQTWPHAIPNADRQGAAEGWYLDRLLSGEIPEPVLNSSDVLFVAGFVKTKPFEFWLGSGENAAGELMYSLTDASKSFELELLSLDEEVTGRLRIDTSDMNNKKVAVYLNGDKISSFIGGGIYEYNGLSDSDTLLLTIPEPSTVVLLGAGLAVTLLLGARRRVRHRPSSPPCL